MNRWLSSTNTAPGARANIFCFPFAGGGASFYRAWTQFAPASISLRPMQPPGREERFTERPFDRMPDLVQAAAESLTPFLGQPYALFGHSMGALVSYELIHELRRRGAPLPIHLFVSGSPAPHLAPLVPPIYHLPEAPFFEAVRRFGGLSDEVLRSRELLDLLMPRLRADLAITGTYTYSDRPPLACPITAFGGDRDDVVDPKAIEGWREHTVSTFRFELFAGGHFFLTELASTIVSRLATGLSASAW